MSHDARGAMKPQVDQSGFPDSLQSFLMDKKDLNHAPQAHISQIGSKMNIENNTLTIGGTGEPRRSGKPRMTMDAGRKLDLKRSLVREQSDRKITTNAETPDLSLSGSDSLPQSQPEPCSGQRKTYQLELGLHESRFSEELVILDLSSVRGLKEGDLAELKTYKGKNGVKGKKIYFVVKDFDKELRKRYKNAQISVLSGQLQHAIGLPTRSKVWVKAKDRNACQADLVELYVKDCLIHRGDMWVFSSEITGSCVYNEQRLTFVDSVRATVHGIYREGKKVLSGYIGDDTKVVFRSESARLVFLIQITNEMWHFEENGDIYFYKVVNSLFPTIFKKWKNIGTHHTITIVFSASLDLSDIPFRDIPDGERPKNTKDYYRIVVDQVNIVHWTEIMKTLRQEFKNISKELKTYQTEDGISLVRGRFSPAIKSNILETICLATTFCTNPFRQPDLRRTAAHVIIVSPGSCIYDVDFDLLKETSKKVQSIELSLDVICLGRPPLHVVPLLRYRDYENRLRCCVPSWINISFWRYSSYSNNIWYPRCKMHDLQMMGLTETEMKDEIAIDYMEVPPNTSSISELMKQHDNSIFTYQNDIDVEERKSISSDFINESKPKKGTKPIERPTKAYLSWNPPRSASPMVQSTASLQVFGDLAQSSLSGPPHTGSGRIDPHNNDEKAQNESRAVNKLKSVTKGGNIAQRIVSRFLPEAELKPKRSPTVTPTKSAPTSQVSRNENQSALDDIGTYSQLPMLRKNISSLKAPMAKKAPFELVSSCGQSLSSSPQRLPNSFSHKIQKRAAVDDMMAILFSWLEIKNPSMPMSLERASSLIMPQYRDVFPKYVAKKYNKWKSLTTPAELPITISSFPAKSDFEKNFTFTNHSVILNPDQEVENQTAFDLLRDMVYVRLLSGFQICTGETVENIEFSKGNEGDSRKLAKRLTKGNYMDVKMYMMFYEEIHKLSCDYDGTINVQRHIRKNNDAIGSGVPTYYPEIKTRYESSYRETMTDPLKMNRERFNWNQLDQMLAGYGDSVIEKNKKQFRSKFVILPSDVPENTFSSTINGRSETLSAEEIRLEGLRRLISSIYRTRLKNGRDKLPRSSRKEEIAPEILFYTGSLFSFIDEQAEILKSTGNTRSDTIFVKDEDSLSKDVDIVDLAYDMQYGKNHLRLVNRKWHWKKHNNCFLGLELVNWLIENFSDIDTRDDAVAYGQELMGRGLFVHVENRHGFLDGHYFYQISSEFVHNPRFREAVPDGQQLHADSLSKRSIVSENLDMRPSKIEPISDESHRKEATIRRTGEVNKPTVLLSNMITVDADLGRRSYKPEICKVHYDRVHNPNHCFHIRLEWLTATPKLIDDLINSWARLCKRYGLKLVEVPWVELCTIPLSNPFHTFVDITLAIDPWKDPEFKDEKLLSQGPYYYHTYLLEQSGFLIDNRASNLLRKGVIDHEVVYSWGKPKFKYAQYIHCTGAYIAEIRENGNLFLAPNNRHLSRVNVDSVTLKTRQSPRFALDAQKIMLDFKKTCLDYRKLHAIFLQAKEIWLKEEVSALEYFGEFPKAPSPARALER
ncbi:LANO_0B00826g1_1 [Lachancea nothofagi CBS 11611]|uniref:Vacuolar membrane-associated protein IML1 n=1 Tax=Lachancea nothofagi CBS 11611 TaxID=1266666 RepID=A0A1G4IUN4_9SACH|nr:LANO_0B00826g1_1 [Lachancea nothofagi CBS 11611]